MTKVKENGKCTKFKEFSRNYNDSNYGSNFVRNILIECSYRKEVLKNEGLQSLALYRGRSTLHGF